MLINLLLLLLPLAAASGWYVAKRNTAESAAKGGEQFTRRYLVGLNYLLNEQPDKAVDVFIKMLEIDSEMVETHLALGALFRRRGEAGRAIRIHQNLIARPNLSKALRLQALLALGEDYLKAGVLDRAERVLLEFTEIAQGELAIIGLRHLVDIYQQEKNWEAAITIVNKLLALGEPLQKNVAHYYCELALQTKSQGTIEQAQKQLKRALEVDPNCARASLLQGDIDTALARYKPALQAYQRAVQQDPDYLAEFIPAIINCYEQLNDQASLIRYLQDCLQQYPRTSSVLAVATHLQQQMNNKAAIDLLTRHLQQRPSVRGLQRLVNLQLKCAHEEVKSDLAILHDLITGLLKNKPVYRCIHCGFNSKVLHWLCPGCHYWGSIKPIQGPEGD